MVMGPTCGMVLADLGAEVIKVEPLGGDNTRRLLGLGRRLLPRCSTATRRASRSTCSTPEGRASRRELIGSADVVTRELPARPHGQARARLRRAVEAATRASSTCSHKGFLPGPYEHRAALDEVVQMMGGLAYMTGPPGPAAARGHVGQRHHGRHVRRDRRARRAAPARQHRHAARKCRARCSRTTCSSSAQHMLQYADDRRAAAADAGARQRVGRLRRVHGQGRRADLPRRGQRRAMADVLRCLRLRGPEGRSAAGDQQPARARARMDAAGAARASRAIAGENSPSVFEREGLPYAPIAGPRICSTTRICSQAAASRIWRSIPAARRRCRCCPCCWAASGSSPG